MDTIRFGRTDERISQASLGAWAIGGPNYSGTRPVGWWPGDDREAIAGLEKAYSLGINHWDTADAYGSGHSERLIGQVLDTKQRQQVFLASKVGWLTGSAAHGYEAGHIRSQLEQSLRNLRTEYLDLFYLHHCDFGEGDKYLQDAVEVLQDCRAKGMVRFIGLSDWDHGRVLRYLPAVDPDVVQVPRNYQKDNYHESGLADQVTARDLGVAFFAPLGEGRLLGKYPPNQQPQWGDGDIRSIMPEFTQAALTELAGKLLKVKDRFGASQDDLIRIAVHYCLHDVPTACALVGFHYANQVDALKRIPTVALTSDDAVFLRAIFAGERGD